MSETFFCKSRKFPRVKHCEREGKCEQFKGVSCEKHCSLHGEDDKAVTGYPTVARLAVRDIGTS